MNRKIATSVAVFIVSLSIQSRPAWAQAKETAGMSPDVRSSMERSNAVRAALNAGPDSAGDLAIALADTFLSTHTNIHAGWSDWKELLYLTESGQYEISR